MSADNGCPEAQFYYAVMLTKGDGVKKNLAEANRYLKKAADSGYDRAQVFYATQHRRGCGNEQNRDEAAKGKKSRASDDLSTVLIDTKAYELTSAVGRKR
jgi:TPR repeat protein